MAIFEKKKEYSDEQNSGRVNLSKTLIIILAVVLVVIIATATITVRLSQNSDNDTYDSFVEQETQLVKKNETITINDPALGLVEIEAVEGFAKNSYTNENFVIDETGKMTYYIDEQVASCMGIDLSEYQGVVDFEKLKGQGFEFVMLRIGGRYYSQEGKMYVDTNYHNYYKLAKEAGLKVGGYFFSQARDADEAKAEADFVLDSIRGMNFDYPVAFDWEHIEGDDARTDDVSGEQLTDAAIAFCDTIESAGFKTIIYSNTFLMYNMYDLERLKDYDFWIADYEDYPSMYYHFTMWQYDVEGQVDGIQGNVDLNICMKNY